MQLGNPSGATADTNNHGHFLIIRDVEAMDYNDSLGQVNWASWDLTAADVGSAGRSPDFFTDTNLPPNFFWLPGDPTNPFSGSGYDRGHMCPSADRTDTRAHNDEVFYMSNIIPQASLQNENIWADFEAYCRTLLSTNEVLILCGPSLFTTNKLYGNHVTIPGYTWKIAVCVPLGAGLAVNRITPNTRVIAINIPNTNSVASDPWQNYVVSVNKIQTDTGFTFFSALSSNLAAVLRSKVDGQPALPPQVSGFSPTSGYAGQNVTVTGTNLNFTTNVAFNGTNAAFSILSPTNLNVIVPNGAATGPITVKTLGGTTNSASSFTVIILTNADLAISATHSGTFTQGDIGNTLSILVTNVGAAAVSGLVSVSNALPAGLAATGIGGAGWTADLNSLTCTRSDPIGTNAAYPPILITVNVLSNAPLVVTNVVTVSNSSETNLVNNTASDIVAIVAATAPVLVTGSASNINATTATLTGTLNAGGQAASGQFDYGLTTNYGSIAVVAGTFTGTNVQPIGVGLTNLSLGTTYHFRASGSNVLGMASGLDQTFTTAAVATPDLAITLSHPGNFHQGDVGAVYVITVTNVGAAASGGTIAVTNILPSGLTATSISGAGWTTNLATLSCTRSDALAAGAGFPPIIITVNVAANASASVTNSATVYGAGDANPANDIAADPTIIIPSTSVLAGWDTSSLPSGGANNYGPSPFAATTNSPNVTVVGLTRGAGVGTNNTGAARGWGGNAWTNANAASAIASNQFLTFAISANAGYQVSFTAINRFDYRHSATGPTLGLLQYQLGSGPFTDISALSYPSNTSAGGSLEPISLANIAALQNVGPGTNVTFRVVNWGGSNPAGTWYVFDVASNSAPDLVIQGTVAPLLAPIQAWRLQYFGTTNNSGPSADTAIASSDGMPNLLKYALGLNPLVPAANPVVGDITTGYLRLTTPKNPNATDITYIVQVTSEVNGPWTSAGTVVDQNTPTLLQVHDGVPVSGSEQRFIRLKITNP